MLQASFSLDVKSGPDRAKTPCFTAATALVSSRSQLRHQDDIDCMGGEASATVRTHKSAHSGIMGSDFRHGPCVGAEVDVHEDKGVCGGNFE